MTGKTREFQREVLTHRSELLRAAMRMTGGRAEAEDLVQETVLRAWNFWHRFRPGTNGRAWMHRILLNTHINRYRRRRREREVLTRMHRERSTAIGVATRAPVPGEELSDEVQTALGALSEDFRRVLLLIDLEQRSYKEAATQLGCPVGTVMSRLHRARKAMQQALAAYATQEGYISARAA